MSGKGSGRMCYSPEAPLRNGRSSSSSAKGNGRKRVAWIFPLDNNFPTSKNRPPSILSPAAASFVKRLRAQVDRAFSFMSFRRRKHKVSSSATLSRSRSRADSIESHRAEAVGDCIEFLNFSSSSLSRSNSVAKASC